MLYKEGVPTLETIQLPEIDILGCTFKDTIGVDEINIPPLGKKLLPPQA